MTRTFWMVSVFLLGCLFTILIAFNTQAAVPSSNLFNMLRSFGVRRLDDSNAKPPAATEPFSASTSLRQAIPTAPLEMVSMPQPDLAAPHRHPAIIEFHAPAWCKPCQAIEPAVKKLVREGYDIRQIDIDDAASASQKNFYNVSSVPSFFIVDLDENDVPILGKKQRPTILDAEGTWSETKLRRFCERYKTKL